MHHSLFPLRVKLRRDEPPPRGAATSNATPLAVFSVNRRAASGRVVQRHALSLGEINDSQQEAWRKTIEIFEEGQTRPRTAVLFPEDRASPYPGLRPWYFLNRSSGVFVPVPVRPEPMAKRQSIVQRAGGQSYDDMTSEVISLVLP